MALAALGAALPAHAQEVDPAFAVQRFQPAAGPRNFLTTRGVRSDGEMAWSLGALVHYAYEPLTVKACVSDVAVDCSDPAARAVRNVQVVENLLTADLLGSFTPVPRFQLGLRIPLTYLRGQGLRADGFNDPDGIEVFSLGDVELEGKLRAVGNPKDPLTLGVAISATAPLGNLIKEDRYLGDKTPTVAARAILDGMNGPLTWAVNLGGAYRGEGTIGGATIGSELRASAAVGYAISPVFRVLVDAFGTTRFSTEAGENTLEVLGAAQVQPLGFNGVFTVGAGTAAVDGIGAPTVRAMLGFTYVAELRDEDRDGIPDDEDECPALAEDRDGYEDSDGCPDGDNDLDTIPDAVDRCPLQAEDMDGFEDDDGCPDLDNDKDGLPDTADQCPLEPETKNGYKDDDGCPDQADTDNDGVPDERDRCPNEPEDTDGFEDTDGCPDPDNDGDGIPDDRDECIDEPETMNGVDDEDGCPDEGRKGRRR
ncbi:MAG: thrombospondin type 3 repeat-containing protein [Pseudomonadota bacterium]